MFSIDCDQCGEELKQPGALLFGPPRIDGTVTKAHLCGRCYNALLSLIQRAPKKERRIPSPPATVHESKQSIREDMRKRIDYLKTLIPK